MVSRGEDEAQAPSTYEEGGWGWVVLASTFLAEFIIYGNLKALSVLLEDISADFEKDLWLTGWMVSLTLAMQYMAAPLMLGLTRRFGYRPVLLIAGCVTTAGYLAAAFCRDFASWSVVIVCFAGVGSGFFRYSLFYILATYFRKRYPLALSIANIGTSCGNLLYGPMTQVLRECYGWRGALLVVAGLTFHLVPCAVVARTPSSDSAATDGYSQLGSGDGGESAPSDRGDAAPSRAAPEPGGRLWRRLREALDAEVLADARFVLVTLAAAAVGFCYVGWAVYAVPHGVEAGLGPLQAAFLTTAFGLGNVIGKVATSGLSPRLLGDWRLMAGAALATGLLFCLDALAAASLAGAVLITGGIGAGNAVCTMAKVLMLRNLAGERDDRLLGFYSWHSFILGACVILAGFASGWLYEVSGSFTATFIMLGFVQSLTAFFVMVDCAMASHSERHK